MKIRNYIFLLLLPSLMLLASCKVRKPDGVISESKMERLLYDYHSAQAMAENSGDVDRNIAVYTEAVLQKHDVTRDKFNKSMKWYSRHADKLYDIYEKLNRRYQNEAQAMGATSEGGGINPAKLSATGDTANVWTASTFALLLPENGRNLFAFHIKADSTFKPRDTFEWHYTFRFIYKQGRKSAVTVMAIRYENDSITTQTQSVYGEGESVMTVRASNLKIKEIEGFIYLDEPRTDDVKLCFISRMSLIRLHDRETPEEKPVTPEDSIANAQETAKKSFIDSIQRSSKEKDNGDHFRSVTRGRMLPHKRSTK